MTSIPSNISTAQEEIERNYRWNFAVNALDGASFWFGMSFISSTIILPLYVRHFTDNPLLIGLIPFVATAGYLVPQLFSANAVERAPRKKFFPVTLGFSGQFRMAIDPSLQTVVSDVYHAADSYHLGYLGG